MPRGGETITCPDFMMVRSDEGDAPVARIAQMSQRQTRVIIDVILHVRVAQRAQAGFVELLHEARIATKS